MPKLSAYILARNEASHIEQALRSLCFADEILVVDTGSGDNTIQLAQQHGADVVQIPFQGFGPTRNKALSVCQHDWVVCLDADERISTMLADEIKATLAKPTQQVYLCPRQNFFLGRPITYSGWYPDYRHPLLFNKQFLQYSNDQVHETYLTTQSIGYLKNPILHYPYSTISNMLDKSNHYSSLGVHRLQQKNKKYGKLSPIIHASWGFFRQYVLQRGFQDGWPGFILAANAFHATFYRYVKLLESKHADTASSF